LAHRALSWLRRAAYGDPLVHPQPETYWGNVSPIGPRSCYDEAKRFSEAITMAYHRVHGLDVRIARIFNTYGERMRPEDGRVVNTLVVQALRGDPITLHGDGSQTRSFCHVSDEIIGLTAVLDGYPRPHQRRQSQRVHDSSAGRTRRRTDRLVERDHHCAPATRAQGDPAQRRPDIASSAVSTVGATVELRDGVEPHDRLVPNSGRHRMSILVTGGAYIGSHTVRRLTALGHEVVVLDTMEYGHRNAVIEAELVEGDIADLDLVVELCNRRDITQVVHFAAYKNVGESMEQPSRYWLNNVTGTVKLVEAMPTAVNDIVFSSSCSVYGTPAVVPVTEDAPIQPESIYAESKAMTERILRWYGITHGLRSVSLRYFNAAGGTEAVLVRIG
jgi:nucleoside-diphosphate-sugar epimerase